MNYPAFFGPFFSAFAEHALIYAAFAFPLFLIFWVIWKKKFLPIRIQETQRATNHHFWHDLKHSASTFLVFAAMDVLLIYLESKGITQLYFDADKYGWPWIVISLALLFLLNDTFFYWSHRAMHHPKLYKFFHRVHHQSTDPSPLTAFAFHPSEAIVENMFVFILPFILPFHFGVLITWQLLDMLNNVLGHLGYEAYPKWWTKVPFLKYKTASTHHNMHHQLFKGNYALYFTWWDKWMGTEFKDYESRHQQIFERPLHPITADGFYTLPVEAVTNEANDAFTMRFGKVPQAFRDFLPGQHVTIKVTINGETLHRTFSLSSVPTIDGQPTLTIKKINGGKVTNYLAQHLKAGDTLLVSAPTGQFFINPEPANNKTYIMIAAGSGITPIYSMIGAILAFEPKSNIVLMYANRNSQSIIFKNNLDDWARQYANQLTIKHFYSEEAQPANGVKGFITRISLEEIMHQYGQRQPLFYLCGPEAMTTKLVTDLQYIGVPANRIHRELFLVNSSHNNVASTNAKVTATIYKKKHQFTTNGQQTILQSALAQNIPLPFSCQSGLCGTCKLKCTQGKVIMLNNQALSPAEVAQGYILTCQAMPKTNIISLHN